VNDSRLDSGRSDKGEHCDEGCDKTSLGHDGLSFVCMGQIGLKIQQPT
jgi:hypothetical protein